MHHAHDKFFRTAMQDKRVVRGLLTAHLPADILTAIDLNHLDLQPRSYINDVRKETAVDMLFKTTIHEKEVLLYLLVEHQSQPDKLMPFRLLKYLINIMDDYLNKNKTETLPLVYPMVIYHGTQPWSYSTDIRDLIDAPRELIDRYFLQPFHLVDLGKIDDEEIKNHAWAGIMEFALKHIFKRDVLPYIKNIAPEMRRIVQEDGEQYVELVLEYAMDSGELSSEDAFVQLVNQEISRPIGEKIMTFEELAINKGMQKGMQKGMEQGMEQGMQAGMQKGVHQAALALSMLIRGEDEQIVSQATGLLLADIELLQKSMMQHVN